MLSVVLVNADNKIASQTALQQLAAQDYPADRIAEVVVVGAGELASEAPKSLQGVLRDFKQTQAESLSLKDELSACVGEVVAFWGDDHVSPPSRLRAQVADAAEAKSPTLLQPNWFFDPVDGDFMRVRRWPIAELRESMESDAALPEGFAELMVCADPLTLVGQRDALTAAAAELEPASKPSDELKDLMFRLLGRHRPKVMESVSWAAVRSPPSACQYESAKPDQGLMNLAKAAWPGGGDSSKAAFGTALTKIAEEKLKPAAAVDLLLSQGVAKSPKQFDLERIYKAVRGSLAKSSPAETIAGVSEMLSWEGLAAGKGDAQAARDFPVFFASFRAFRRHVRENADLYDMKSLADVSEGVVRLAMGMWASDARVNEVLAMILARELIGSDMQEKGAQKKATNTADVVGTLGLRDALEAMSVAAVDMPGEEFPVDVLIKLSWAMGQAGIENGALQMKVAKGILRQVDKLTPPDIGQLFIVIHELQWFKDDNTIRYLLGGIMNQIKVLKQNDPGLAKILASSQA